MNDEKATLTASKSSQNKLNPDTVTRQLSNLAHKAIGKTLRLSGWANSVPKWEMTEIQGGYRYVGKIVFRKRTEKGYDRDVFQRQYDDIDRKFFSAGKALQWAQHDGTEAVSIQVGEIPPAAPPIKVEIPDNVKPHFAHLYDRDAQINVILASLKSAVESEFKRRTHICCYGQPGCGKSETLAAFVRMVGEHACLKLDATASTKAGAEKLILNHEGQVPPFLIIEEIEKCNPANLPWLLGLMDQRGEIRKTNAKIMNDEGQNQLVKQARMLVLATVNNLPLFKSIMSGALASRFAHHIYFPRPSRVILKKILAREIKVMNGKDEWIEPALDYADEEGSDDPRRVISLLDGREKLVSGEYQSWLRKLRQAEADDQKKLAAIEAKQNGG